MRFSRYMLVTLLASFGGVLGNLIAAFLQSSLGLITPFQVLFMIIGVILVAGITYTLENKKRKKTEEVEQLRKDLAKRRVRLRAMQSQTESGMALTAEEYEEWYSHQAEIAAMKERLREEGEIVADEYIDSASAPKASRIVKLANSIKAFRMFFVIVFAFLLSFPLSIGAQAIVESIWNIPTEPELPETLPAPLPTDTIEISPTEPPAPEPTESFPEENPTEEAVPEPGTTPTLSNLVPTETPTGEPVTASRQTGGGGGASTQATPTAEGSSAPRDNEQATLQAGTGEITGRVVWDSEPVEGVQIDLTEGVGSGIIVAESIITGLDGTFRFQGLEPKQYGLIVNPPEGFSINFRYCGYDIDHVATFNGLRFPAPIVSAGGVRDVGNVVLAAEAITALDPINGKVITDRTPILSWEPYPGADRYVICVLGWGGYDYTSRTSSVDVSDYKPLNPGALYWEVYAFNDNGLVAYSKRNDFILTDD